MWSKEREKLESKEFVYFEDASELSIDEHEMNQLLGSNLVENDAQMILDEPKSDSPSHSLPKTPVFKPNISVFNNGFSFLEPSIHNFEDIQSVPITPVLNPNIDCLITKNFPEELNEMNNDYNLAEKISQFVIKPLMDNIEKMFVKNSSF
ncbi:hypothetical protein BpHYR1_031772 [Brachionus plicatilis]|uniref:Uncharacterized protein n=1 Tax=Brachionus plicatilis TaxID=10195 RepID=A0A3M7Q734_BRAPC|nr:hypothetical protein BpHYR1_031772 [Brachionus plicatilis]